MFLNQRYLIFCLALFSQGLHAESLENAWNIALDNNHQIKAAQINTSASEEQLESAKSQRLPLVNVGGNYTQQSETPSAETQIAGQTVRFPVNEAGSFKAQALATVPVFTSGRISHNISAAEASLEAAHHNEDASTQDIKMQVADAYVTVLRAQSALQVAKNHAESLSAHLQDVNNLYDQGVVAKNDQLAANVELVNAEQLVVQASNRLDIAKANYNQLLDRDLAQEVTLEHSFPAAPADSLNELNHLAVKQRPELAAVSQQIESLEQQSASVKAANLPQVDLNGGYQYQQNRFQAFQGIWSVGAGVQWKLFDNSVKHQSDAISRQAISMKEQRDDLTSKITLQVRQAWLDVQETEKRISVTQKAIEQADENMRVTKDRYHQGLSTNTDVIKAEDQRIAAHDNLNNANYDATLAKLKLRRAIGAL
ncbi:MAG: transporter [Methylobacter sp.]|nr:MAG: transporter [Methylobacter sp.]PPD19774.1 MAG: transporter [Methylobacter sp.]